MPWNVVTIVLKRMTGANERVNGVKEKDSDCARTHDC